MRRKKVITSFSVIALIMLWMSATGYALSWRCPYCGQTFYFDSRDGEYMNSFAQRHMAACGSSYGASSGGGYSGDPTFDMMMPLLQEFFNTLGQEIFEDPQAEARAREQEKARQAELKLLQELEKRRLDEEQRRREEERKKKLAAIQQRMMADMMQLADQGTLDYMQAEKGFLTLMGQSENGGQLELMGMEETGEQLKPIGTSFFGLGGGSKENVTVDASVVDLRHLRQGAYLVQAAAEASSDDAQFLMEEALQVIDGAPASVVIPQEQLPMVNEDALQRFQKANNEFRRKTDSHLIASDRYTVADAQFRKAAATYEKALQGLEQAEASNAANLEQLHAAMAKAFNQLKELDKQHLRAKVEMDATGSDVFWTNTLRRRMLSEIAVPVPKSYTDMLAQEREALSPSISQRIEHEYLNVVIGKTESAAVEESVWKEYRPLNDPKLQAHLDKLLDRIRSVSPYPNEPKSLKIIGDPIDPSQPQTKQCFATADTIYIGAGYLNYDKKTGAIRPSDDELLFVMSHETAHVHRHHFAQAVKEYFKFDDNFEDGFIYNSRLSDEDCERVREMARNTMLAEFNQAQELEADRAGTYMAIAAGAKPQGIKEAFDWVRGQRKLAPKLRTEAERIHKEKAATHPLPEVRQQAIEKIYGKIFD